MHLQGERFANAYDEGTLVNAEKALKTGLVDIIYPPDRIRKEVEVYAEALSKKPAQALTAIRRTITEGDVLSFEKGLEIEYESAVNLAGTKDFSEGIQASLEKENRIGISLAQGL